MEIHYIMNDFQKENIICARNTIKRLIALLNDDADHYDEAGGQLAALVSRTRASLAGQVLLMLDNAAEAFDNKAV